MAKKRGQDDGALIFLMICVAAVLVAVGPASIIAAIWFVIRCTLLSKPTRERLYGTSFDDTVQHLSRVTQEMYRVKEIGQTHGLRLRQDGWFDGRNPYGADLNSELTSLQQEYDQLSAKAEHIEESASHDIGVWVFNVSGRFACILGTAVYLMAVLIAKQRFPSPDDTIKVLALAGVCALITVVSAFFLKRSASEREILDLMAAKSGSEQQGERQDPSPKGSTDARHTWFEVLGVSPTASPYEIKAAYKVSMKQYHPDLVASLGPELRELAESKTKEINAAYAEGMNSAGQT